MPTSRPGLHPHPGPSWARTLAEKSPSSTRLPQGPFPRPPREHTPPRRQGEALPKCPIPRNLCLDLERPSDKTKSKGQEDCPAPPDKTKKGTGHRPSLRAKTYLSTSILEFSQPSRPRGHAVLPSVLCPGAAPRQNKPILFRPHPLFPDLYPSSGTASASRLLSSLFRQGKDLDDGTLLRGQ